MKKCLKLSRLYWIDESGEKQFADFKNLTGNVAGLWGDVSGIRGDVSGLWGNVSGLRGNVDECEITDEERENGVNIKDLCDTN